MLFRSVDKDKGLWISYASSGISRINLEMAVSYFSHPNFISTSSAKLNNKTFIGTNNGLFEVEPNHLSSNRTNGPANFVK